MQHTQQPIVTGTSVLGLSYEDGVILAADNLGSYGSLARFRDVTRLIKVGPWTVVGISGDISDMQYIHNMLEDLITKENYMDDGHIVGPKHVFEYLSRVMYSRRTKMDPLWNSIVVAGIQDSEKFLAVIDLLGILWLFLGTNYKSPTVATGFGAHLAQPILRKEFETVKPMDKQYAIKIIENCMKVLYYRDARSLNKFQTAIINKDGVVISESYSVETNWDFAEKIRGYGA